MKSPLIVIDPGHGGVYRSNVGPTGYIEADGVLDISLRLAKLLTTAGYNIKLTRSKDETVELYDRPEMANRWQGELFISSHTDASSNPEVGGAWIFHTLVNEWNNKPHAEEAKRVAAIVQKHLVAGTGLRDRGIHTKLIDSPGSPIHGKDYYAVIRKANMPALIIESGFHSNPREEALLKTPEFRQKIAESIFKGIQEAYPIADGVSKWAQDAWDWGIKEKITDGTNPKGVLTREQCITMLHRYDNLKGGK